jgi:hypothetical protein
MRSAFFVVLSAIASLTSCAHTHFEPIVASAYVRDGGCDERTRVDVEPLSSWGFRARGCGEGEAYYRCYFERKTLGKVQCCARVASAGAATAVIALKGRDPVCEAVE